MLNNQRVIPINISSCSGWWFSFNPSEKWWSSSVRVMTFPTYGKSNKMFQTTNQSCFLPSTGFLPSNCLVFFTQFCELNPDKSYAWWSHVKPPWNNYIKPPLYHIISYYIILYHIISLFTTLSYIKPSISISIKYHEKPSNPLVMHWWSQVVSWTDKKDSFWDASIYIYTYKVQVLDYLYMEISELSIENHQIRPPKRAISRAPKKCFCFCRRMLPWWIRFSMGKRCNLRC